MKYDGARAFANELLATQRLSSHAILCPSGTYEMYDKMGECCVENVIF